MYHEPIPGETITLLEEPFGVGEPLISLVQEDWEIFSEALFYDYEPAARLLDAIVESLDEGERSPKRAHQYYVGRTDVSTIVELWGDFCDEVKRDPWREIEPWEVPESLFEGAFEIVPTGTIMYRARLGYLLDDRDGERVARSGEDMGAPPPEKATSGRANEPYKSVLYCAEQEKTAVAEIRPARGLLVSVCQVQVRHELRIFDLSTSVDLPNPFTTNNLNYEVEMVVLRNALGKAFGEPLDRHDDPLEYLPTQKFARFVKRRGFDGIRYPSAMISGGTNVVVFDQMKVQIGESALKEVTGTSIEYKDATRKHWR